MNEALEQIWTEVLAALRAQAEELGEELGAAVDEAGAYAAARTHHLSMMLNNGEPGFAEAVIVERDNVALKAGLLAVNRADSVDARFHSVLGGMLNGLALAMTVAL